ncbi:class I SAM-dependent methyltransferase [Cupriavidus lacunae]|uniref:Methyltransferase domain-containing protein n=1 Tax=Cupriavidus lacunae TaxID=2666307 RepID=A0A370NN38_9BURK|nr:class I SAM-dependent methyltransferase [Cupriavidus lacunae]RDK07022.1 hypothetical protein DN412_28090 [Cupriavidus lacunae]
MTTITAATRKKPLLEALTWKFFDFEDYLFEKRHGLDLGGIIAANDLMESDRLPVAHASAYHAVWCRNLRELFAEAGRTGEAFDNFIDLGSGKGKACFYAHTRRPFGKIVGVELSDKLNAIANGNLEKFRSGSASNISFTNADATEFELPDASNLIFMFNPFDDVILRKFVSRNLEHFRKGRSMIAYANDVHRATLEDFGFTAVFRNPRRKLSLHRCQ